MAFNKPVKGVSYTFYISLESQTSPGTFQSNPTIVAGDFNISKDDGTFAALTTTPTVDPSSSVQVKVQLSGTEMNADHISFIAEDAAGDEWFSQRVDIHTIRLPAGQASGTPSTTVIDTDLTVATDDQFNDQYILFLNGDNAGVSRKISDYDGTTTLGEITVATAFPTAPSSGDEFVILGRSE